MKEEYAGVFKALSHPSRLRLLELLSTQDELSVAELTAAMPRQSSTVSRNLSELRLQGLVNVRPDAQNRFYSLNAQKLIEVFDDFLHQLGLNSKSKD